MNIKEQIGQRIQQARKAKNLTQAKLAELAGDFSQSRLNNWEKGIRTPGLEEVKGLAKVLQIAPSYLMCLSDESNVSEYNNLPLPHINVPLLSYEQATNHNGMKSKPNSNQDPALQPYITLNQAHSKNISSDTFAVRISDKSMEPILQVNDILIIDPNLSFSPGSIVAAHMAGESNIVIRELRQRSHSKVKSEFELVVTNPAWANTTIDLCANDKIIGVAISYFRNLY